MGARGHGHWDFLAVWTLPAIDFQHLSINRDSSSAIVSEGVDSAGAGREEYGP